ncbi:MAG: hypothetical protein ACRDSN_11225 [Pseudonocardiaceae bacterium]
MPVEETLRSWVSGPGRWPRSATTRELGVGWHTILRLVRVAGARWSTLTGLDEHQVRH